MCNLLRCGWFNRIKVPFGRTRFGKNSSAIKRWDARAFVCEVCAGAMSDIDRMTRWCGGVVKSPFRPWRVCRTNRKIIRANRWVRTRENASQSAMPKHCDFSFGRCRATCQTFITQFWWCQNISIVISWIQDATPFMPFTNSNLSICLSDNNKLDNQNRCSSPLVQSLLPNSTAYLRIRQINKHVNQHDLLGQQ